MSLTTSSSIFSNVSTQYRISEVTQSIWNVNILLAHPFQAACLALLLLLSVGSALLSTPCMYENVARKLQVQGVKLANATCLVAWAYLGWTQFSYFPDYAWETVCCAFLAGLHLYILWIRRSCCRECPHIRSICTRRSSQEEKPTSMQNWQSVKAPLLPVTSKDACTSPSPKEPYLQTLAAATVSLAESMLFDEDNSSRRKSAAQDAAAMSEKMLKFYQSKLSFSNDDKPKDS